MVLAHKVFYHTDTGKILLHYAIQPVIGLKDPFKHGVNMFDDKVKPHTKDGNDGQENERNIVIDAKGHDHGEDEHGRAADKGTNDHHKSILHIAHIGSQTGDQTSAAEFINIGEGVYLQMMKHIMPQIASKACRGACTAPAAQCTKSKRYQCKTH